MRQLLARRDARSSERRFVVEGAKAIGEALDAGAAVESVLVDDERVADAERRVVQRAAAAGAAVVELERGVMARVAGTVAPQGVMAVVEMVDVALGDVPPASRDLVVVCAEVRDPGNLGTIVRTAGAAGAGAVVSCSGSVDLYNPKTVRASAGAVFHVPVVAGPDAEEVLDELGRWGLWRWGTVPRGGRDYAAADLAGPVALTLGNEAHGLPPAVSSRLDGLLSIPMAGPAESLNVAATAAVLCFEAARQRRAPLRLDGTAAAR